MSTETTTHESSDYETGTGTAVGTWGCKRCGCVVWDRRIHNTACTTPPLSEAPQPG